MLRATEKDKDRIVAILLPAFENNKSVSFICGNGRHRLKRIRLLIEYAFKVCSISGNVFISEDRNACALVLLPDKKRTTLRYLLWNIQLIIGVIGSNHILKVLRRETIISKLHPKKEPMYYLWFIGTHPDQKSKGIGSKLLLELIKDAKQMDRSIYLETSTIENLPWYKKFGFNIYGEVFIGFKIFLLKSNT